MRSPRPDELRRFREHYGITQREAAQLIGVEERSWRRYEQPPGTSNFKVMKPKVWAAARRVALLLRDRKREVRQLQGTPDSALASRLLLELTTVSRRKPIRR